MKRTMVHLFFKVLVIASVLSLTTLTPLFGQSAVRQRLPSDLNSMNESDWISAFEIAQKNQLDFHVESLEEFKAITNYYDARIHDGTEVHRFRLSDGNTIQCILIHTQGALTTLGKPEDVQLAPQSEPSNPTTGAAPPTPQPEPANVAKLFGMDGFPDEDGNLKACPNGSFPRLMAKLENLYHFRKLEDIYRKYPDKITPPDKMGPSGSGSSPHEYAAVASWLNNIGLSAYFNVWAPYVQGAGEFSLSQLWESGGSGSNIQTAEAGWQVYPNKYGDTQPHFFIYFTTQNYQQIGNFLGCYNLSCIGFVQTNSSVIIGGAISPVSTIGGNQDDVQISYYRDVTKTGNWWLQFQGQWVGYYPDSLYNSQGLASFASQNGGSTYGGEIVNSGTGGLHTTTQMGSGHFPSEGWQHAAYIRKLQYVDLNNNLHDSVGLTPMTIDTNGNDTSMYYKLSLLSSGDLDWGQYLYFGGPGRIPLNPNLTPYQPSGWSDKIVVTNKTGCTSTACMDSSPLYTTDTLYVDWAVINNGSGATSATFYTQLYVDGVLTNTWQTAPPLNPNYYVFLPDYSIGSLSSGSHAIKIVADSTGAMNEYTKTITVQTSQYSLNTSVNPPGSGTVNPSGTNWYNSGQSVSISATANSGYSFNGWSGDLSGISNPTSITMTGSKNVIANFTPNQPTQYTLSININPSGGGSVSTNPNKSTYNQGDQVQLTATPSSGYSFSNWTGDASGNTNPLFLTMNGNKTLTANFTQIPPNQYTLTVTINPSGSGTVSKNPDNTAYNSGDQVTLTATATSGYAFANWTGDASGSTNQITLSVNGNKAVTANFNLINPSAYWTAATLPYVSQDWELFGVHFYSSDNGWAVGYDDANKRGILLQYSNGNWMNVTPPAVSSDWMLSGVNLPSADEGWAVGYDFINKRGVILHYSNGAWLVDNVPSVSSVWDLCSIYFTSSNEGWAVGNDDEKGCGVVLHYLNGSWTVSNLPSVSTSWVLSGIHFVSQMEGWAVGSDLAGANNSKGVLLHYLNGSWASVNPPQISSFWILGSVYFTSGNEGWAVGSDLADVNNSKGVLLHYLNGSWASVNSPNITNLALGGIYFTSGNEGWATGDDYTNNKGVLFHYLNGSWALASSPNISSSWQLSNPYCIGFPGSIDFTSNGIGWITGSDWTNKKGVLLNYSSETVSIPNIPGGPISGIIGTAYAYSTGGSISNLGHTVQYRFDWGDGSYSDWSSSTSASKSWASTGTFQVKAQARCATDSVESNWSNVLSVTIGTVTEGPDLTGSWTYLTQTCKNGRQGQKCSIKGTFAVSNIGNRDAPSTSVNFYLSDNGNFDQTDTFLKSFSTGKLKAGKGKNINLSYNLPTGISASGKYVIAVIDPSNLVGDINESNNIVGFGPIR